MSYIQSSTATSIEFVATASSATTVPIHTLPDNSGIYVFVTTLAVKSAGFDGTYSAFLDYRRCSSDASTLTQGSVANDTYGTLSVVWSFSATGLILNLVATNSEVVDLKCVVSLEYAAAQST